MRKSLNALAACALVCLFSATASAAANFVYHEQTNNFVATPVDDPSPGCGGGGTDTSCGRYVENTDRSGAAGFQIFSPETYSLHFKIEFQFYTNQVRVFYTTDGSTPQANDNCSGGGICNPTPAGTTQVALASYTCLYSDVTQGCQIVDVATGSIPPQAAGTTVKYIISAWHSGGGPVVYANSGGPSCSGCFMCTSGTSGCATVFQYNVIAAPATPLIISEFRLRGTGGANDEFVEIYNNSNSDVTVNAFDGSAGFALAASDGVTRFTIPNGTVIPARGHYLGVNSVGYTLGTYPSAAPPPSGGGTTTRTSPARGVRTATLSRGPVRGAPVTSSSDPPGEPLAATGDVTYTNDITDNAGIALFKTANAANFTLANRLDAAGSTAEGNALFKEGAGYPAVLTTNNNHSFYRSLCSFGPGGCSTGGLPRDTGDNASDFLYVSTDGTNQGAGARLGAPGPENLTSPIMRNSSFGFALLDATQSSANPPNRVRDFTPDAANNSPQGTLSIRRRVVNNTGANVTRLRFRIIEVTTFPPGAGQADLRARTSSDIIVSGINDPATCAGLPAPCLRNVRGTTLEEANSPADQPNGGGYNSSLSAGVVTLSTPLAPTDNPATVGVRENEIYVQFLLGVVQGGAFRFYINIEALP